MAAKYIFDSNVFINLQRRQPIDIYPSVWEKISSLMEKGTIISSTEVFEEITGSDDELSRWAKKRKKYFLASDTDIQHSVREILKQHRGLVEGGKKKNNADPFVIALAQITGCAVITEETHSNSVQAPKIPDICDIYGVNYMDFVGFSREMKLTF
jgi:hypothetical protein